MKCRPNTGRMLTDAMESRGFSMNELARRSGLNRKTIKRMCEGDRMCSIYSWMAVCEAMGCELSDIIVVCKEESNECGV